MMRENNAIQVQAVTDLVVIADNQVKLTVREVNLKNLAQQYGGTVIDEHEDDDAVGLTIQFESPELMEVFKNAIGIK